MIYKGLFKLPLDLKNGDELLNCNFSSCDSIDFNHLNVIVNKCNIFNVEIINS
jgi:hypothetical protein